LSQASLESIALWEADPQLCYEYQIRAKIGKRLAAAILKLGNEALVIKFFQTKQDSLEPSNVFNLVSLLNHEKNEARVAKADKFLLAPSSTTTVHEMVANGDHWLAYFESLKKEGSNDSELIAAKARRSPVTLHCYNIIAQEINRKLEKYPHKRLGQIVDRLDFIRRKMPNPISRTIIGLSNGIEFAQGKLPRYGGNPIDIKEVLAANFGSR
jgi:hypothetical protein